MKPSDHITEVSVLYYGGRNCMFYQINVSVIERGVRYIVGGLYKVGILRLIVLFTTLKYLYFWARDCIRYSIFKGWFSLATESESESES